MTCSNNSPSQISDLNNYPIAPHRSLHNSGDDMVSNPTQYDRFVIVSILNTRHPVFLLALTLLRINMAVLINSTFSMFNPWLCPGFIPPGVPWSAMTPSTSLPACPAPGRTRRKVYYNLGTAVETNVGDSECR